MPDYTIDEQIRCVEREISYRTAVYPYRVVAGKMTEGTKNKEIALMEAVLATLKKVQYDEEANPFDF